MASILIIDDNVEFGELVTEALWRAGHTVRYCRSGKEAFATLRAHAVDLVITDIVMPEADGLEVLMRLRRTHPQLKVVVMSGDAPRHAPHYLMLGRKLGAKRSLLKPFSMQTVIDTVSDVLDEGDRTSAPH